VESPRGGGPRGTLRAAAMSEKKQRGKKKDSFSMTWMNPVMLPATPANAPAPPMAAPVPTAGAKAKFQWKAPTRGWHNGVPPGMPVPPAPPASGAPGTASTLPEKRPAAPAPALPAPKRDESYRDRNCLGPGFNIDDWLCGAAALCTQRPGAPSPATDMPDFVPLASTQGQGVLHVQAAKVPYHGCGGEMGSCLSRGGGSSRSQAEPLSTPLQPSPTLDDSTLDELMLVEEEDDKGGLWKLVTDLFAMPQGWGEAPPGSAAHSGGAESSASASTSHTQTPPPTLPVPSPPRAPHDDGDDGGTAHPAANGVAPPALGNAEPFAFALAQPPVSPPDTGALFLDSVLKDPHGEGERTGMDVEKPQLWETATQSAATTTSSGTSPAFSTNGFSSATDLSSLYGTETGNGSGSPRADGLDLTPEMDTAEVMHLYEDALADDQLGKLLQPSPHPTTLAANKPKWITEEPQVVSCAPALMERSFANQPQVVGGVHNGNGGFR